MSGRVQQAVPYSVQAADILRERILSGEYELGKRLGEVELSESLGISRSPLREALRALAAEGLVTMRAGRGVFVADFGIAEVRELLELREALDTLAVRLAAQRATPEQVTLLHTNLEGLDSSLRSHGAEKQNWPSDFHLCIYEVARNSRLLEQGTALHTQIRLVRFRSGSMEGRIEQAHEEHLSIVAAIEAHDAASAEQRMREHLANGARHILDQLDAHAVHERVPASQR